MNLEGHKKISQNALLISKELFFNANKIKILNSVCKMAAWHYSFSSCKILEESCLKWIYIRIQKQAKVLVVPSKKESRDKEKYTKSLLSEKLY